MKPIRWHNVLFQFQLIIYLDLRYKIGLVGPLNAEKVGLFFQYQIHKLPLYYTLPGFSDKFLFFPFFSFSLFSSSIFTLKSKL